MHKNILIASIFPMMDLLFLVKTWKKDGKGVTKTPGYSHFFQLHEMDLATHNLVP